MFDMDEYEPTSQRCSFVSFWLRSDLSILPLSHSSWTLRHPLHFRQTSTQNPYGSDLKANDICKGDEDEDEDMLTCTKLVWCMAD
jgi:hypothetical protein